MLKRFKQYIIDNSLFHPSDKVLLAVSGGPDSVVMTHLFAHAGFSFGMATCNFMLRKEESDKEEEFVRKLADDYKVEFYSIRFDTRKIAREQKISVQMAARNLRYRWLEETRRKYGFNCIATGHHLDDQIETVLINFIRGTGIAGFHGMKASASSIVRPLLFATREEILQYAVENGIEYMTDSSNLSSKYFRNDIRLNLIPLIKKINPDYQKTMSDSIMRLQKAEIVFREAIEAAYQKICKKKDKRIYLSVKEMKSLKPLGIYLYEFLSPYGFNYSVVEDIAASLDKPSGKVFDSATHQLLKDRDYLIIYPLSEQYDSKDEIIIHEDTGALSDPVPLSFECFDKEKHFSLIEDENIAFIDKDRLQFPLKLRKWKRGDYFYPAGFGKRKKLSDFFIDKKIARIDKKNVWILQSGEQIVWIVGYRIDDRFKITHSTRTILKITRL